MKLVKRSGTSKYRVLYNDKEISIYKIYLYDEEGIIGIRDNHFPKDLVEEVIIPDVVFSKPNYNDNKAYIYEGKNEFGRKQKILFLPSTPKAKKQLVKSKAGDIANRIEDYNIYFYKSLVSVSDLYFYLQNELPEEKAAEIGKKINKAFQITKKYAVEEVEVSFFPIEKE